MPGFLDLQAVGAILLSFVAAAMDAQTGRIPNHLTVPGVVLGLTLAGLASGGILDATGMVPFSDAIATTVVVLVTVLVIYSMGLLGGGDAKLLVALAAWVGFPDILVVAFHSLTAAVLLIFGLCLIQRKLFLLLRSILCYAGSIILPSLRERVDEDILQMKFPFGVAVFLGVCVWYVQRMLGLSI